MGSPHNRLLRNAGPQNTSRRFPKPKKRKGQAEQTSLLLDDIKGLSTQAQEYEKTAAIFNAVRQEVGK